jgi:hypothetical protein
VQPFERRIHLLLQAPLLVYSWLARAMTLVGLAERALVLKEVQVTQLLGLRVENAMCPGAFGWVKRIPRGKSTAIVSRRWLAPK